MSVTKEELSEYFRKLNSLRKTRAGGRKGKRTKCRWCNKTFPSQRVAIKHQGSCPERERAMKEERQKEDNTTGVGN